MKQLLCNAQSKERRRAGSLLLLESLTGVFCYLYCFRYGVFGAKIDWISQHTVLPDYFRQQFYETGELFPEFAANIGGGQNIYNFSYYGLYNPLLLPSYLLPFVKMSDYMMAVQFFCLTGSVLLMHCWLKKKRFSESICIGVSAMLLLSAPMIYHSYKHIMFVNYMPFLLTGLMGVDRYFEKETGRYPHPGLVVSIFLMIMTSFYFSIGGMVVLGLYGLHRYLAVCEERKAKVSVRAFFAEGMRFAAHFLTAVMLSGILLVPTAFALAGRKGSGTVPGLEKLLVPEASMVRICYSPYGIGMTVLAVIALLALLFGRKRSERVLAIGCATVLTIPLFAYLLNGGLYVRDKAMIPFLPLLCYNLAYYLDNLEHTGACLKIHFFTGFLPYALTAGLIYVNQRQGKNGKYGKLLMLDSAVTTVCYLIVLLCQGRIAKVSPDIRKHTSAKKRRCNAMILLAPALLLLAVIDYCTQENMALDRKFYQEVTNPAIGELIKKAADEEEGFYRTEQLGNTSENKANMNRIWDMKQYISSIYSSTCHEGYRKFRKEIFGLEEAFRNFLMQPAVRNPVYQRFMGVKYVVSKTEVSGYDAIEGAESRKEAGENWKVYENHQVSPVAYGTDRVISEEAYRKLGFPYHQLALLNYAVVKDAKGIFCSDGADIYEWAKQISLYLPERIDLSAGEKHRINLPDLQENKEQMEGEKVLFLRFRVENQRPSRDVSVWVEGIRNTLTAENDFYYNENMDFTYAVPLRDGQEAVEMIFGKGRYKIKNVRAYIGILPQIRDASSGTDPGEAETENRLYQAEFRVNQEKTKGNRVEGTIVTERPGYFITTIPYDENFEILTDGKPVKAEEVNTAFLGFRIGAGKHEVSIVYHAPGMTAGKLMSMTGICLFAACLFLSLHKIRNQ